MIAKPVNQWSLCLGRWRGVELRIHVLFPLLALGLLLAVQGRSLSSSVATWAIVVWLLSVMLHEVMRVVIAARVGGHTASIVIGPVGGWTKIDLPDDPPAHLVTALAGPLTFLVVTVAGGCGLSLAGDRHVLDLLIAPCDPRITSGASLHLIGQLIVWINGCLLLVNLLPIEPCAGAELLRGVLWPVVGRSTAASATSHLALGAALLAALFALVLAREQPQPWMGLAPSWFPFAIVSIFLLYGGRHHASVSRYDVGLAIDDFDSDDEAWLAEQWTEEDPQAVLVEHLQDKQQEAIDRKRRKKEANEDARVDAILSRLRDTSFEQLSEEERAILKRASRRYRERQKSETDD